MKILKRALKNFTEDLKESLNMPANGIEKFSLGESVEKRPIDCYRIGSGRKKILFVSAIHGNEIGTIKLAYFLLEYLNHSQAKYGKLTFFVVPCLNPDGFKKAKRFRNYFTGKQGRLNAKNVDLNRNFPTPNFRSRCYILPKKYIPKGSRYSWEIPIDSPEKKNLELAVKNCGEFGGSEPEIKALVNFVEKERVSIIFSFHNIGRDVMGGQDDFSKELVKIYAKETGYEILEDSEWRKLGQTGTAKDWCDNQNISFVEVEGSTRYGSDRKIQKSALEATIDRISASS